VAARGGKLKPVNPRGARAGIRLLIARSISKVRRTTFVAANVVQQTDADNAATDTLKPAFADPDNVASRMYFVVPTAVSACS